MRSRNIKLSFLAAFALFAAINFVGNDGFVQTTGAFTDGPPPGFSGAPDEQDCTSCHEHIAGPGTFSIIRPAYYFPGRRYRITVRHASSDTTRQKWGFQLTSLVGASFAGSFINLNANTQIVGGTGGRDYIEQTAAGTFEEQTGGATWNFDWTAPQTNVGPVTFYAAGNQANNGQGANGDRILTASAVIQTPRSAFDIDGDTKADVSIFRPSGGEWWYRRSIDSQAAALVFGVSTDVPTPADFTGDGKMDVAFFRPSTGSWFILRSENGTFFSFPFGSNGDIPMPADYDGDLRYDAAVYRPSNSLWVVLRSTDGQAAFTTFGAAGDQPVASDYDGDGRADIAIWRPSGATGGEWWILRSTGGTLALQFGSSTDKAVPADYTGDGRTDVAFWRPTTGNWFILRSEDFSFFAFPWGATNDIPAPADYDGDGRTDAAIFRSGEWFINRSTGGPLITGFGIGGDRPVPGAYVR